MDMNYDQLRLEASRQLVIDQAKIESVSPSLSLRPSSFDGTVSEPRIRPALHAVYKIADEVELEVLAKAWEKVLNQTIALRTRTFTSKSGVIYDAVLLESFSWVQNIHQKLEDAILLEEAAILLEAECNRFAVVEDMVGQQRRLIWTYTHGYLDEALKSRVLHNVLAVYENVQSNLVVPKLDLEVITSFWKQHLHNLSASTFPLNLAKVTSGNPVAQAEHVFAYPKSSRQEWSDTVICRAALATLLARYTNTTEVLFGLVTEELVQPSDAGAQNVVPTRVFCEPDKCVSTLMQSVAIHDGEMRQLGRLSLADAINTGNSEPMVCRFQTVLQITTCDTPKALLQPVKGSSEPSRAPYGLHIDCQVKDTSVRIFAQYDPELIDVHQMTRFLRQLGYLMLQLLTIEADVPLRNICAVTEEDLAELEVWNSLPPPAHNICIHDVVTSQARARPHKCAISAWDGDWTNAELDGISTRLASWLSSFDLQCHSIIPLYFEKSKWVVVSMLGVLKAGHAFTLIDPSYPLARVSQICEQTSAIVALTSKLHEHNLGAIVPSCVVVDNDLMQSLNNDAQLLTSKAKPQDLAYVLFTSGSTGTPKGSMIQHGGFASCVLDLDGALNLNTDTRALQFASYAFGASLIECLMTLMHGGCVCIPSEEERINSLSEFIRQKDVNWTFFAPSFMETLHPESIPSVRTIILGGEPMTTTIQGVWGSRVDLRLAYGQSESSTVCSAATIQPDTTSPNNIGRAAGARLWIIDQENYDQLAPIGAIGELMVESSGVARGYLVPQLQTLSPFITTIPSWLRRWRTRGSEKLYRTGDLARYASDGTIQYLGRKDSQVKIRGQRVELGDIEAHMRQGASSGSTWVVEAVNPPHAPDNTVLVAFLIRRSMNEPIPQQGDMSTEPSIVNNAEIIQIRIKLEQTLPQFAIPSYYIAIQQLPKTLTGKTDREGLRAIGARIVGEIKREAKWRSSESFGPMSNLQSSLRKIWFQALDLDPDHYGWDADFFMLGGDSIIAIRMTNMARTLGISLQSTDVLRYHVLEHLATKLIQRSIYQNPIRPTKYGGPVEQSFAQGRLWFLDHLKLDKWSYNVPMAMHLKGKLQLKALEVALTSLEQRHETLRTTFEELDGVGVQVIHEGSCRELTTIRIADGNYLPALHQEQKMPFDLASETGWRIVLFEVGENDHVLSIVMHHIISDGWSLDVLRRELSELYSAACRGREANLEPLPIQYRDFSNWQRDEQQVAEQQRQLEYWTKQLMNSTPAELLSDYSRPAVLSGKAGSVPIKIGDIHEDLQAFCRSHKVTVFVVLLAAFRIAHYRLTGAEDGTIGVPIANRNRPELESLIGFFVNTQCLRISVEDNDTFQQIVQRVCFTSLEGHSHQDVPFERIVSATLPGSRDRSRNPLVQLIFALHSQKDLGAIHLEGLQGERVTNTPITKFDAEFHLFKDKNSISGHVMYAADLFERETIECVVAVFQEVLRRGLAEPQTPVSLMPLTDGLARLQDMGLLEIEQTEYPRDSSIVDVFREQVSLHPQAVAVKDSWGQLSYAELDFQSEQLALWLYRRTLDPETLVGVLAPRSCETIIAFLGILKANMAYLPLDVNVPNARTETILSAAVQGHMLVLLGDRVTEPNTRLAEVEYVSIKDTLGYDYPPEIEGMIKHPTATSLAYVIFTSGSTGKPKGVMAEHRGVNRLVKHMITDLPPAPRVAHMCNIAFDISAWEIYAALLNGGTLVCVDYMTTLDSRFLESLLERERIDTAMILPSLLSVCLANKSTALNALKVLYVAGERLNPRHAMEIRKLMHGSIYNAYGPTENTVLSTAYRIAVEDELCDQVPIGRSIANSGAFIMDTGQRLVSAGVIGELVVTGDGLARGYTDPKLNTDRFVLIEEQVNRSIRGYRTGDRVRYRPRDGQIEFLGRMDRQVKVRGSRVELAEVEYAILAHEAVHDVVVLTHTCLNGELDLVAFLTIKSTLSIQDELRNYNKPTEDFKFDTQVQQVLRNWLKLRMPGYMIPTRFILLKEMPINANGKVNRQELKRRTHTVSKINATTVHVSPRNEVEIILCEELADVLQVETSIGDISVNDNFFDLGGHSLMATKLAARVSRRLNTIVSVKDVFDCPVVADLAATIKQGSIIHIPIPHNIVCPGSVAQSFAQGRLWFLDQLNPGSSWYVMPLAWHLYGQLDVRALFTALYAMQQRHETLRSTFEERNGTGVQIVHDAQSNTIHMIEVEQSSHGDYLQVLKQEQKRPFRLAAEPGWRVMLLRLDESEHILSIVMHHIISDGWSLDVLQKELSLFYSVALRGSNPTSQIAPLAIQYRDFALWQKQDEQVSEHRRQLQYWVTQLADSTPAEFFADYSRPALLSGKADFIGFTIDGLMYQTLREFCRDNQVTTFVVLLAVFRAMHYRLTGAEDATVGTPIANRNRPELETMIGFFVNTQCMRITVQGDTFAGLVQKVRSIATEAFANQDVPFEQVVSAVKPGARNTSRNPLVQLLFAMHSQHNLGGIDLEGLQAESIPAELTTRFDIEIHLFQAAGKLDGKVVYATELFAPETVQDMVVAFQEVLRRGLDQPETPISTLALTDGLAELRCRGLLEIPVTDYARDSSIVQVFREQVKASPEAVAVKDWSPSSLTYTELDRQSDKLASWLRGREIDAETSVGVLAPRSCETVIAFLGILKANLAYLPLELNVPKARNEAILSSLTGSTMVLLGSDVSEQNFKLPEVEMVRIASVLDQEFVFQHEETATSPSPTSLAYVVFTSGSTGKPKGVKMEHRGVVRLVKESNVVSKLPATGTMQLAHLTSVAFDVSIWEICTALLNGGTLICIDYFVTLDSKALHETFLSHVINVAMFTPALLKQCLQSAPSILSGLELVYVAGDRFDVNDAVETLRFVSPETAVYNAYGPSENGMISTIFLLDETDNFINGVPIGQAVNNSGVFVMDPDQNLVSAGVMGELIVTGDGLARGYTDPVLDVDRFISVTIDESLVRAYRTGDRVRHRPIDRALEFHGRIDRQIKIRGHRIELAEVEHAILQQPRVSDAAVVATKTDDKELELTAFLTMQALDALQNDEYAQVKGWEDHFETNVYADIGTVDHARVGSDFMGWTSMYDGSPIDDTEMKEWLGDTMQTILGGQTLLGHVWEIGTGTGMILFNLPEAGLVSYAGLEPSHSTAAFVNRVIGSSPTLASIAKVHVGTAKDVDLLSKEAPCPDLVVLNSVAQYFPSQEYLLEVVEALAQAGAKKIFFGDVRSYTINKDFLASRAVHELGDQASKRDIAQRIAELEEREEELLIDPSFFTELARTQPNLIKHVEIQPKRMHATNELSSYRYAAVLHLSSQTVLTIDKKQWIDFQASQLDHDAIIRILQKSQETQSVAISNIPYAKISFERHVVEWLGYEDDADVTCIADIRRKSQQFPSLSAVDLERLANDLGFRVEISWARQNSRRGALDAVFHRHSEDIMVEFPVERTRRAFESLTNRPLQRLCNRQAEHSVREQLQTVLPSYMIPARIIALEKMPVNANGKVDRIALAKQARVVPRTKSLLTYVAPRSEVEAILCDEFKHVLGIEVGVTENFFELGGHSLMATKLAARLSRRLETHVSVKDVFDHPMIAHLATLIQQGLTPHVQIAHTPYSCPVEQSFAQSRLWFLDQLAPEFAYQYIIPVAMRLHGELCINSLSTALQALVQRHETLRTTFEERAGVGVQVVHSVPHRSLDVLDFSASRDTDYLSVLKQQQTTPFDLASEPGWRVSLLKLGQHDHILSIVMHHIISDGWSVDVLRRELSNFYRTALKGYDPLSRVTPLKIQYRDFAFWQKEADQLKIHQRQLDYWMEELADNKPAEFFCDFQRPTKLSGKGATISVAVDGVSYTNLRAFCRKHQVTTFVVLLTAFRVAHYRLTGAEDATIGIPIANRNRPEIEDLIGFFANNLPIRIGIDQKQTFQSLVDQVWSTTMTAHSNQDVPFERITSAILPGSRDTSRNPLVQLMFAVHSQQDLLNIELADGISGNLFSVAESTRFDLEFHLFEEADRLSGKLIFATDLFQHKTIQNVLDVFQEILRRGLEQPEVPVSVLPMTDGLADLRSIIEDYPRDSSLVKIFREQVHACPDRLAVTDSTSQLTYSQLDRESEKLANWLKSRRMAPETVVGVLAKRSCQTIVVFLGIMKAGLAYLPLDSTLPVARIATILSTISGQKLVLVVDTNVLVPAADLQHVELIRTDDVLNGILQKPKSAESLRAKCPQATSLAYIIFTSGSTGIPKGVMVQHRSVVRVVKQSNAVRGLPTAPRVAHMASIAFDMSTWEIYTALLNSGTLVCIDNMTKLDPNALRSVFEREKVDTSMITPTLFDFCSTTIPSTLANLRLIHIAGERLSPRIASKARQLIQGMAYNSYGPTENTILSTSYDLMADTYEAVDQVPIGRAVSNSGAYIMDPQQKLVSVGVIGELVVTGDGLARGYTDPVLNTNRFVHVNIDGHQVEAYRTGDRARLRPIDEQIEFHGRLDRQVKVRGHRIELAEVENSVLGHSIVREAVVVLRLINDQENQMVCFVTVTQSDHRTDQELEHRKIEAKISSRLQASVPSYMVPWRIIVLDKIPMNTNGKIDRGELEKAARSIQRSEPVEHVAPQSELEVILCDEFADVLGKDIGMAHNFFELGGHSLMATKIAARISRRLDTRVSVKDIFDHPTIADLATTIRYGSTSHVPISQRTYSKPVKLSFAQGRLWFMEKLNLGLSLYMMPVALHLHGHVQIKALTESLYTIQARHETLRTTFGDIEGVGVQTVQDMQQQKKLKTIDVTRDNYLHILKLEQTAAFDLTSEPGWRVSLLRLGQNEHVLSIVMHHIVSDGWSLDVLQRELSELYRAAITDQDLSRFPQLPIQYRDFATWQHETEQSIQHRRQLAYWTKQLSDSTPAEFLLDYHRPSILSGNADAVSTVIDGALYESLTSFCRTQQVTAFVVLLAAFRAAHYRCTGKEDSTIGTPIANRNRPEFENMIGFFVNTQCMRISISREDTFASLVQQVRTTATAAFDNQDVPFEQLVSALLPGSRNISKNPLVQVLFAMHSQHDLGNIELEGLRSIKIPITPTTRFDMEFHVFQHSRKLVVDFIFATDLFRRETIQSIIAITRQVLDQGLKDPTHTTIVKMPLNDGVTRLRDRDLLRIEKTDYPRESNVVDAFLIQVAAHPEAIAVKDTLSQLTYSQLNEQADKLASWLRLRSMAPEALVGVLAPRSCETVIAFLAILKANLAYLPFDEQMPIGRINTILSDAIRPKLVLIGANTSPPAIKSSDVEVMRVSDALAQSLLIDTAKAIPIVHPSATSLAYVMFTSGSTGRPKGVMIEHKGITHLTQQSTLCQKMPRASRVSHLTSIAFDMSTFELYSALLNGFTLVCIDYETILESKALATIFESERLSVAVFTPPLLKQILSYCRSILDNLDVVVVGGDCFDPQDAVAARSLVRGVVYNGYGPTENTVFSTIYELMDTEKIEFVNGVPIGRAIGNSGAYVMDAQQRIVSPDVMGELVVTGDGLARGYTDLSLNTNCFIQIDIDGQLVRAYRTGDRVRSRSSDDQIEFFGRMDRQVKIRGHRIELEEIEVAIRSHPEVQEVAILVQKQDDEAGELASFVTVQERESDQDLDQARDQIGGWSNHFETSTYKDVEKIDQARIGNDFTGWTSMFDGTEIPTIEMQEWLDDTMQTILRKQDRVGHVLEIGTGTGMILFNLPKSLQSYVGIEPSYSAAAFTNKTIRSSPRLTDIARVYIGTASDVTSHHSSHTDLVVINSVVQYFPSSEYLMETVETLLRLPGVQTLFFGDIRSLAADREFLAARALHELGDKATKMSVERKIAELQEREEELLVSPAFFTGLKYRLPDLVQHVEILPKIMEATNELSCYRYAAVVYTSNWQCNARIVDPVSTWIDFQASGKDYEELERLLKTSSEGCSIALSNIPHNKTIVERHVIESLDDDEPGTPDGAEWLSNIRNKARSCTSFSAWDLCKLAKRYGYHVEISWARQSSQHNSFDALFHRGLEERILVNFPADDYDMSLLTLTNHPLERTRTRRVESHIKESLGTLLPPYMIPTSITVLDKMPLNTNGKIDHRELAKKSRKSRKAKAGSLLVAPRNETEKMLVEECGYVLGVKPGVTDNFFDLGGHSLMATKLTARLTERLRIQIAVKKIFEHPKLEDLARYLASNSRPTQEPNNQLPTTNDEAFQLLAVHDKDAFVQRDIMPYVQHCKGRILDVYPATAVQEDVLVSSRPETPAAPVFFFVDFPQGSDCTRLYNSCFGLVQHFDIFRTVFVPVAGKFYQVVFDRLEVPIKAIGHQDDLASACVTLQQEDLDQPLSYGHPMIRIAIIRTSSARVRVALRMSHALYDGLSFEPILHALHGFYNSVPLPESPKFSLYVQHMLESCQDGYEYWRSVLRGSSMTVMKKIDNTSVGFWDCGKSIDVSTQIHSYGITQATIFTTACALAITRRAALTDVVIGRVVSGRQALSPACANIVGPCTNIVPLRVSLESNVNLIALLQKVQDQYLSSFAFETIGFDDIKANCTDWPKEATDFGCVTSFQSFHLRPESEVHAQQVKLDNLPSLNRMEEMHDLEITGLHEPGSLQIQMFVGARKRVCDEPMTREILDDVHGEYLDLVAALQKSSTK
ncbi:acetyl-CoA synthetase-like protein [Myriangium duriaei CBS 260.36]|uniref:Acetyl-CoA synthetase-like protein n=1 Tax=Myriangium duriaei CBS 260.36 TaxID=1168546 RepID=A0A9P4IT23_9PEZI|nr:acetyl-CoA synthetase-like protein [Myriangium duriaei CBS 260.36]